MNKILTSLLLACLVACSGISLSAQKLLLWDDINGIISSEGEQLLLNKLAESDIDIVMTLDYKKRCEYHYAELTQTLNQATLTIYDCNRKVRGSKTWMGKFFTLTEEERVTLLAFSIIEIVEGTAEQGATDGRKGEPDDGQSFRREFNIPFNHHSSRHFFSPSSYNLRTGELYYSTLQFLAHELQYGITDYFSIGMGTTVALNPFYITPKFSWRFSEKDAVAVGTLFMLGTWTPDFLGNLGYVTYTRGDQFKNVTLGLGHVYAETGDVGNVSNFIVNLSGMTRLSDNIYFITENYYLNDRTQKTASYYLTNEWTPDFVERIDLTSHYIAGISGFRLINKNHDISAFQFGLSYIFRVGEPIPKKYTGPYWEVDVFRRIVIPTVGYVIKLGKRV